MINVIVDQGTLRIANGLLYRLKLLSHIEAGFLSFKHLNHRAKMSVSPFQAGDHRRMGCMFVLAYHMSDDILPQRMLQVTDDKGNSTADMRYWSTSQKSVLALCACAVFLFSAIKADLGHLPKLISAVQEHAEMASGHLHSNGFADDLLEVFYGHQHGTGDHEHAPDLMTTALLADLPRSFEDDLGSDAFEAQSIPPFLFERPPQV